MSRPLFVKKNGVQKAVTDGFVKQNGEFKKIKLFFVRKNGEWVHKHEYDFISGTEPTCVTPGNAEYQCPCGNCYSVAGSVDSSNHEQSANIRYSSKGSFSYKHYKISRYNCCSTETWIEEACDDEIERIYSEATCTLPGAKGWYCSKCSTIHSWIDDGTLPPIGHNYSTDWYYEDGYECYQKCTRAGCDERFYNSHIVGYSEGSAGKYGFYCKNCYGMLTDEEARRLAPELFA